jgi:hypothetical protein
MVVGLTWLAARWRNGRWVLAASLILTMPIFLNTAINAGRAVQEQVACRATPDGASCFSPVSRAFLAASRYAADSLPPGSVVLTIKESPFYIYSGHRVMHPQMPVSKARDHVLSYLTGREVYYILLSAYPGGGVVAPTLKGDCQHLEQIFAMEPWTYLLRVQQPGEPPPRLDGCTAITEAMIHTKKSGDR